MAIDNRLTNLTSFSEAQRTPKERKTTYKYQFKYNKNAFEYIVKEFSDSDSMVKQTFYSKGPYLIYSTEFISYYYGKDTIRWGGKYYFSNGKLKDYETLGHGKSEKETWQPENEVFRNYRKAKEDISEYLRKKNGG